MSTLEQDIRRCEREILTRLERAAYAGCVNIGIAILNRSIPKAPVDTGNLRNSSILIARNAQRRVVKGKKNRVRRDEDLFHQEQAVMALQSELELAENICVIVAFIARYAVFVHEGNPSFNWNDGGPKFLERGYNEVLPLVDEIMKNTLRKTMKGQRLPTEHLSALAKNALRKGRKQ